MKRRKNKYIHFYEDINNKTKGENTSTSRSLLLLFLDRLRIVEKILHYKSAKTKCSICGIVTKNELFNISNFHWNRHLQHYITKHKYMPSREFINFINSLVIAYGRILNPPPLFLRNYKIIHIILDHNKLEIIDALFIDGSKQKYLSLDSKYLYSEHAGLLSIVNDKISSVVVSAHTNRVSEQDKEIFLPTNSLETFKHSYIFHTHPLTPELGSRVDVGILYEFPSISDISNFLENAVYGVTIGSIVVAPEGIYVIRKAVMGIKTEKDKEDINRLRSNKQMIEQMVYKIQDKAIVKYTHYEEEYFYKTISRDFTYIDEYNVLLNNFNIHIDYYPRVYENGYWIIKEIIIPIYV